MSELLWKVEMMAQSAELYEDEVRIQMPMARSRTVRIKDIIDVDYKKASFFMAGKMTLKYRENGIPQSVYYPFNFMFNEGMETFIARLMEIRGRLSDELTAKYDRPEVVVKEIIKVRCAHCGGLMDEADAICPVCGRPH